jgi:hypothetical protein
MPIATRMPHIRPKTASIAAPIKAMALTGIFVIVFTSPIASPPFALTLEFRKLRYISL